MELGSSFHHRSITKEKSLADGSGPFRGESARRLSLTERRGHNNSSATMFLNKVKLQAKNNFSTSPVSPEVQFGKLKIELENSQGTISFQCHRSLPRQEVCALYVAKQRRLPH